MQIQETDEMEIFEVGFWGRLRYGIKAFWAIVFLRPIFVTFDDEEMYARTNLLLMTRMVATLIGIIEQSELEQNADKFVKQLLKYSSDRIN